MYKAELLAGTYMLSIGQMRLTVKISFPVRKFILVPEKRHSKLRIKAINAPIVGSSLTQLGILDGALYSLYTAVLSIIP